MFGKTIILCAALAASSVNAQGPSIEANGNEITVSGSDLVLNAGRDTISVSDLSGRVSTLESLLSTANRQIQSLISTSTVTSSTQAALDNGQSSAISSLQSMGEVVSSTLVNQTTTNGNIGQAVAANTNALTTLTGNVNQEISSINGAVSAIQGALPNNTAVAEQFAALNDLTALLRNPNRSIVYGPFVSGDDRNSPSTCGQGLNVEKCEVERMPGDTTGPYLADGLRVTSNGCVAVSHVRGASIRSKVTCSNIHVQTQLVQGDLVSMTADESSRTISCPSGFRALHCMCHSPWGQCGVPWSFGFTPTVAGTCVVGATGRMSLAAVCINNN